MSPGLTEGSGGPQRACRAPEAEGGVHPPTPDTRGTDIQWHFWGIWEIKTGSLNLGLWFANNRSQLQAHGQKGRAPAPQCLAEALGGAGKWSRPPGGRVIWTRG